MQSVIVTGATGLLGKSVVSYFKDKHYQVIQCSKSLGHDLTNEEFVREWFMKNRADHLINLFALNEHVEEEHKDMMDFFSLPLKSVNDYLQVNVTALFSVCREYARNNETGNIINFSSIYGLLSPDPNMYANGKHKHVGYVTSKAAVLQLTKYLAAHLSPRIRVNCVVPGGVLHDQSKEFIKKYSSKCPLGRMMSDTEITGIINFLCSEDSSYCTGAQFVLDGGYTIW